MARPVCHDSFVGEQSRGDLVEDFVAGEVAYQPPSGDRVALDGREPYLGQPVTREVQFARPGCAPQHVGDDRVDEFAE